LADKLDQLACFFAIDERPTGAGDPYALRRADVYKRQVRYRPVSAVAAKDHAGLQPVAHP